MLLSKLYLATGQWEKAIQQLNEVIDNSGYSLMTNTFGTFVTLSIQKRGLFNAM